MIILVLITTTGSVAMAIAPVISHIVSSTIFTAMITTIAINVISTLTMILDKAVRKSATTFVRRL